MLAVLACCTLVALASIGVNVYLVHALQEAHAQALLERRELLERIQRPERTPTVQAPEAYEMSEQPADEWGLVGTINRDPDAAVEEPIGG